MVTYYVPDKGIYMNRSSILIWNNLKNYEFRLRFCNIQYNFYLSLFFNCIFFGYHCYGVGDIATGSCAPGPSDDVMSTML